MGNIGESAKSKAKGIWAHSVVLLDADTEQTVGLVDQQRWIRDANQLGKRNDRKQRQYKEKESFKWQQSSENIERRLGAEMKKTMSVCDREADVYEYLQYKRHHSQRFVVRGSQNRTLENEAPLLFDT